MKTGFNSLSLGYKITLTYLFFFLCASPLDVQAAPSTAGRPSSNVIQFGDFYSMPVGPEGLEPSEKLLSLSQQSVSIIGYIVAQSPSIPGRFILSPLPISIDPEDEGLADDLPTTVVYVHFDPANQEIAKLSHLPADTLFKIQGTLSLGQQEEVDGRVSSIRLNIE